MRGVERQALPATLSPFSRRQCWVTRARRMGKPVWMAQLDERSSGDRRAGRTRRGGGKTMMCSAAVRCQLGPA